MLPMRIVGVIEGVLVHGLQVESEVVGYPEVKSRGTISGTSTILGDAGLPSTYS